MKTSEQRREGFIIKALEKHAEEGLDYSKVIYIDNRTPVEIVDPLYGSFWQTPYNHLRGQSHPCRKGDKIAIKKMLKQDDVIERFKKAHTGENLDYSKVVYKNMHTKVTIIDHDLRPDGTEYGEYEQEPAVHLKGCGHPDKGKLKQIDKQTLTREEFIERCKDKHSDCDWNYECVEYKGFKSKVKIFCNKKDRYGNAHGFFEMTPDNLLKGKGCAKCSNHRSYCQEEIIRFLERCMGSHKVKNNDHNVLDGKEIDIYLPSLKIGFEYNGLRWHSEEFGKRKEYHLSKTERCEENSVSLYQIFENEFLYRKAQVFARVKKIIGSYEGMTCIGDSTKYVIRETDKETARKFIIDNDVEEYSDSNVFVGVFIGCVLIKVYGFKLNRSNSWTLITICESMNHVASGAFREAIIHFIEKHNPDDLYIVLNRRWYSTIKDLDEFISHGFRIDSFTQPGCNYTDGNHSFSEYEIESADKNKFHRIWDCGYIKLVYDNAHYLF